jgi:hypothetical protein
MTNPEARGLASRLAWAKKDRALNLNNEKQIRPLAACL